jgi:hypothetical protein
MNAQELVGFLNHVRVWLPKNSQIRTEVTQVIANIRAQAGMPSELTPEVVVEPQVPTLQPEAEITE